MKTSKTCFRFFTIADFEEEEIWLRKMHNEGWKLIRVTLPGFYKFEKCEPEDVIYRLEYPENKMNEEYKQMYSDFGWEYFTTFVDWNYFRKSANEVEEESDGEIFSDRATRLDMINRIYNHRMLPIVAVFLCCILPIWSREMESNGLHIHMATALLSILFVYYMFVIIYCGVKLLKLRRAIK